MPEYDLPVRPQLMAGIIKRNKKERKRKVIIPKPSNSSESDLGTYKLSEIFSASEVYYYVYVVFSVVVVHMEGKALADAVNYSHVIEKYR